MKDLKAKRLTTALQNAQAACDLEPNWSDAFYVKASILEESEDWLLEAAAYTVCLRMRLDHAEALGNRGLCKLISGDFLGARPDFTEAIRLNPNEINFRRRAANDLRMAYKDAASALADIQEALARADKDTPAAALHVAAGIIWWTSFGIPSAASIPSLKH